VAEGESNMFLKKIASFFLAMAFVFVAFPTLAQTYEQRVDRYKDSVRQYNQSVDDKDRLVNEKWRLLEQKERELQAAAQQQAATAPPAGQFWPETAPQPTVVCGQPWVFPVGWIAPFGWVPPIRWGPPPDWVFPDWWTPPIGWYIPPSWGRPPTWVYTHNIWRNHVRPGGVPAIVRQPAPRMQPQHRPLVQAGPPPGNQWTTASPVGGRPGNIPSWGGRGGGGTKPSW